MSFIVDKLVEILKVKPAQVVATVQLLDEGASVPFIARYRKEATGGLDDTQLRELEQRLNYLRELQERRDAILKSISEQGKLTKQLEASINQVATKTELEDLYLPFKPKRRSKAQIACEAGLQPLAEQLLQNPQLDPEKQASKYLNSEKGIVTEKDALEGARHILIEQIAENASLLAELRAYLQKNAFIQSSVIEDKIQSGHKFTDYFDYAEQLSKIPGHRALALFRGRAEGVLKLQLVADRQLLDSKTAQKQHAENKPQQIIARHYSIVNQGRPADDFLQTLVVWSWRVKLQGFFETELLGKLREQAESKAIEVFAANLRDLLMIAPAGKFVTLGLDPGFRTGVKLVVLDDTGKLLNHLTIFPHQPQQQWDASISKLAALCQQYAVKLISIGNGTASRETDKLVSELMQQHPQLELKKVVVNEAGASVYSASPLAAKEFPKLDVSYRGAVSIARRLQDPLAELVKIEPKAIGVGQYQHDVSQSRLNKTLASVVEDCVNAVGVDLNTASPALLTYVSGLNKTLATNIVEYRQQNGRFKNRQQLMQVERLGAKAYEQAAGFLRINQGENPLDSSAVHPETYPIVEKILNNLQKNISQVMGNTQIIAQLNAADYIEEKFGLPTVKDILLELQKPGRDPRGEFKNAKFKQGVEKIADLTPGIGLQGAVTNVTDFGAFVDIGVHQDGLVHISMMSKRFIKHPREVVKTGDIVNVHVIELDVKRKRISLSMIGAEPQKPAEASSKAAKIRKKLPQKPAQKQSRQPDSAFAMALSEALNNRK